MVNYPKQDFRIKTEQGKDFIFDHIRKVWIPLTEEEWVRQNFVQYMIQVLNYPQALIAIEKGIMLGELKKRFDILVYNRNHQPWMLVECKSRGVQLRQGVLEQVLRYNISVPVSYLVITNGHYTFGWQKALGELKEIREMPNLTDN